MINVPRLQSGDLNAEEFTKMFKNSIEKMLSTTIDG